LAVSKALNPIPQPPQTRSKSPIHPGNADWFDNLTSSNGKCCSFAHGFSVSDVEWDTDNGHYRVLLHGEWINVPNSSIVTEPNRYGPAVVWPYMDSNGNIYIRCFLPGAGA
jgi:hypothetical protein